MKIKNYGLFLFCIAFLIRIISIFLLKVEIADDFETMYKASLSLLKGNLDFMNGFYFRTYPFQLGLTLYQAILLKIWNNVISLKIMNSLYTSLIVVLLYKISRKIVKEEYARMISLGYIFFLYPIYLNSVLTNQHIPALITLYGIYRIITKEENIKTSIVVALLLGIANFFRTESIIIILGIICYNIAYISKDTIKKRLKNVLVLLITYFLCTTITSQLIMLSPLNTQVENKESLEKNVTIWKFYCGLSTKYNGIYNVEDQDVYFNSKDEKQLLIERINKDKWNFPILFLKKEVILWTQTNYDLRINNLTGKGYQLLLDYNQGFLNLVMILFVISLIPKKKEEKKEIIFIKILIALYFGIYLLIEISPRYAYNLHMLVFLLLGLGIERCERFIKERKKMI